MIHLGYFYGLKRSAMVLSDQIVSVDATKHNSSIAISVCVMQHRNRPQGRIRFQGVKTNNVFKIELGGKEKKHESRATASDEPSGLSGLSPTGAQSSQKPLKTGIWT